MDKHSDIHDIAEQPVTEVATIPKSYHAISFLPTFGLGVKNAVTTFFCKVESESAR